MEIRKRYVEYKREPLVLDPVSMTKQSDKDSCDINRIVKRGVIPPKVNPERYMDLSDPVDYQEALNLINNASEQFSILSADVRKRFDNDPKLFLEFATNPKNASEMVKLGLATPKPVKEPAEVVIVEKKGSKKEEKTEK